MARPLRIEYEGAKYHVINRGNFRHNLFEGSVAAESFEKTLGETAVRFGWKVHAYVVMRNHFHLALEITEANLSHGMKWLQGTWTRRSNSFRRVMGPPFQDRYKSLIVEPGSAFGQVCHYIHLNPVRAGAVKLKDILDHPWSSLPKFCAKARPAWLAAEAVLASAGELRDDKRGWAAYSDYLEFLWTDKEARGELVAKRLSRGWCVGGQKFRREISEKWQREERFSKWGDLQG